ncbi:thiol:disulfide interchange protein TlpA [Consotaella salsifontis]|uniref:Thiol-disulfide isomerase or thioredoxin n=1 Tax=Consotaella salsifontis TaxID=1365950 RepID=A0A1T4RRK2_9HYPH|nr:TlpA disulfide reductase family protein [Consotaella salsifontis]SKA18563.1 Thiol-disulfide isomerase or thioredoxin [Consotaella salsifontis]
MADSEAKAGRNLRSAAALALVAGLLVGAGAVYVTLSGADNQAGACPLDADLRDRLAAAASGEVAAVQPIAEPFDASSLSFTDADGKDVTLASFTGKALLLNIWATWCVPCREEMPALDALEAAKGGPAFAVVPVNVDLGKLDKPRAFYEETALKSLPLYHDATMGIFNQLKTRGLALGLPISLLVDDKGCARAAINGPAEWASPDAIALVDALTGSKT